MAGLPEFAAKIKAKYPQYADMPDDELAQKMIAKFPQYKDMIGTSPAPAAAPDRTFMGGLKDAAQTVLSQVDAYTGAPLRGAISGMQDESESANPSFARLPGAFIKGAVDNIGNENAPTGKQVFQRAGFSGQGAGMAYPGWDGRAETAGRGISPAGALGFALDLATPVPGLGAVKQVGGVGMRVAEKSGRIGMEATAKAGNIAAAAADIATGTKVGTKTADVVRSTVDFAKDKAKQASDGIKAVYGGAPSKEWGRWEKVAKENGIDPETLPDSFKFGKHSISSRLERYHAQDDIMGEQLRDKWQGSWNGIQEALGRKIDKIAGAPGVGYGGAPEAGGAIRKQYEKQVNGAFENMDTSYRGIANEYPRMFLPPASRAKLDFQLNKIQTYAKDLAENSADQASKAQGVELLQTVANARGKTGNFGEFVTSMQGIGRSAFKNYGNTQAILPPDVAKLRQMYHAMSETAVDAVGRQVGEEAAGALKATNAKITEITSDKNILKQMGAKGLDDSKLFGQMTGDPLKMRTLKKYLDAETLGTAKAAYLRELLTDKVSGEGTLSFKQLHNALRNRRHAVNSLFDPQELAELRDLVEMGSSMQPMMLSTSGTGSTMMTQGIMGKVGKAISSPLQTAGSAVDAGLSAMQKSQSRAIGFDMPDVRQAAQGGQMPPMMGLSPYQVRGLLSGGPPFRKKALQMYGAQEQEEKP